MGGRVLGLALLALVPPGVAAGDAPALPEDGTGPRLVAEHRVCTGAQTLVIATEHTIVGRIGHAAVGINISKRDFVSRRGLPPRKAPELALVTIRPASGWVEAYRGTARRIRASGVERQLSPASNLSLLMAFHGGLDHADVTYVGDRAGRQIRVPAACRGVTYVSQDFTALHCRTDRAVIFTNFHGRAEPAGWILILLRTHRGWIEFLATRTQQHEGASWRIVAVDPFDSARIVLDHGGVRAEAGLRPAAVTYRSETHGGLDALPVMCRGET